MEATESKQYQPLKKGAPEDDDDDDNLMMYNDEEDDSESRNSAVTDGSSSAHHIPLSDSHEGSHPGSLLDDDDDDDWEEDDFTKRYNLDIRRPPMPYEFDQAPLHERLWHSIKELRTAARQRQAARLLHMPSESWIHRTQACIISHGLDATDEGMALVVVVGVLWILIGCSLHKTAGYWLGGMGLLAIRIGARPLYIQLCVGGNHRRQRLRTRDAMEFQREWKQQDVVEVV